MGTRSHAPGYAVSLAADAETNRHPLPYFRKYLHRQDTETVLS